MHKCTTGIILFLLVVCFVLCAHSQNQDFNIGLRRGGQLAIGSINEKSALTFNIEIDRKGFYGLCFEHYWSDIYFVGMGSGYDDIYEELIGRVRKIKLRDVANKREVLSIYPISMFFDLFYVCYVLEPGTYTFSLEIDAYAKVDFYMGFMFDGETTLDMPTRAELFINEQVAVSSGKNYVMNIVPRDAVKSLKIIDNQLALYGEYINGNYNIKNIEIPTSIEVQYFDGLGRPEQTVQMGITPSGKDLVSLQTYDAFGREDETWLPGLSSGNGAYVVEATAKINTISANLSDQKPFFKTVYEPSPLNRPVAQYGPGADWHNNSKAVTTAYKTNISGNATLNCRLYLAGGTNQAPTLSQSGNYATGQLYVTELKDENGNVSYEFKDKLGQVVLTRQINASVNHDTYYVYNDYGNLCFVLPPLVADNGTNQTERDKYAYQYKYDDRNRCIYKKLPGCEPIFYIYDKADQLIFSQDGEQRLKGEWAFTLPDAFGRIVLAGTCTNSLNYLADPLSSVVVTATRANATNTYKGYGAPVNITLTNPAIFSVNYYDDYAFMGYNGIPNTTDTQYTTEAGYGTCYGDHQAANKAKNKGLFTGTLTAQMKPDGGIESTYLYSVMYYDNRGRVVQVKSNNHLSGGLEKEYIAYNFTGQPTQRKHVHSATGKTTLTETYAYTYDHARRLTKTTHQLTEGTIVRPQVTLAENTYDELGRLKTINKANNSSDLKTDYTYNVRSWLKTISSPLFNQTLYYNDYDMTQYNGNISFMTWNLDNSSMGSWYQFSYDQLSRLTKAVYAYGEFYSTSYAYDKHGNITNIMRRGGNIPGPVGDFADNMTLTYTGNQLTKADDAAPAVNDSWSADFKDYAKLSVEYTYNKNGAMAKDLNKGIEQIEYNSLNLPRVMLIKSPAAKAKNYYTYSASGVKLRTEQRYDANLVANPVITTTPTNDGLNDYKITEYVGNIIYETSKVLSSAQTSKTRILIDGGYIENGEYYYYITDHLGNNRAVAASNGVIAQRSDYYPFGMALKISNDQGRQPYKYNGKELDQMHGLNTYDYSARYYDPGIARFTSVDPLAEKYYSLSPYVYCMNNPLKYVDPQGDTVRVYTETIDGGHAWMSVGEGENMVVYSFGPGNGRRLSSNQTYSAQGNLVVYTGEDAQSYIENKKQSTDMVTHTIEEVSDSQVSEFIGDIISKSKSIETLEMSNTVRDPVTGRVISKEILGTVESFDTGRSYGNYNVLTNNCTTFVSDVMNGINSSILSTQKITYPFRSPKMVTINNRFVIPASLREKLNK